MCSTISSILKVVCNTVILAFPETRIRGPYHGTIGPILDTAVQKLQVGCSFWLGVSKNIRNPDIEGLDSKETHKKEPPINGNSHLYWHRLTELCLS